jgi:predicted small secreted protein
MKTYFLLPLLFLLCSISLNAQEYSIAAAGKTIQFN